MWNLARIKAESGLMRCERECGQVIEETGDALAMFDAPELQQHSSALVLGTLGSRALCRVNEERARLMGTASVPDTHGFCLVCGGLRHRLSHANTSCACCISETASQDSRPFTCCICQHIQNQASLQKSQKFD